MSTSPQDNQSAVNTSEELVVRIAELEKENAELLVVLRDYEADAARIFSESCGPAKDQVHCTCVPPLRKRIAELEGRVKDAWMVANTEAAASNDSWLENSVLRKRIAELEEQVAQQTPEVQEAHAERERVARERENCRAYGEKWFATAKRHATTIREQAARIAELEGLPR